jgi:hypothetical protein
LDFLLNLPTGPVSAVIAFLSDGWRFACMYACTRETLTRGGTILSFFCSSFRSPALLAPTPWINDDADDGSGAAQAVE